jgi:hypothetical protein
VTSGDGGLLRRWLPEGVEQVLGLRLWGLFALVGLLRR